MSFVENEMPGVSLAFVKSDLHHRWQTAFIDSSTNSDVEAKATLLAVSAQEIPSIANLPTADAPTLLKTFEASDALVAKLNDEEIHVARLQNELGIDDSICSSRPFFDQQGLGALGLTGPLASLIPKLSQQRADIEVGTTYSFSFGGGDDSSSNGSGSNGQNGTNEKPTLEAAGKFFKSVFDARQLAEQNAQLEKAVNELPAFVAQPGVIFDLSTTSCKEQYLATQDLRKQAAISLSAVHSAIQQQRIAAQSVQELVATYLRPMEIQAFADADPTSLQLSAVQQAFLQGELLDEVHRRMLDVQSLAAQASLPSLCADRVHMGEDFEDAVTELHAEIALFRHKTGNADDDAALEVDNTLIESFIAHRKNLLSLLAQGGCK